MENLGYFKQISIFWVWINIFCLSAKSELPVPVIYDHPVEVSLVDFKEALMLQVGTLDPLVPQITQIIKSLKKYELPVVFHYLRELKNLLKKEGTLSCPNVCLIVQDLLGLWEKNWASNSFETSALKINEEDVGEVMLDFAIAEHKKLRREPDVFFKELAHQVVSKISQAASRELDVNAKRLGEEIYMMIEFLICKVTWLVVEHERIWYDIWELAYLLDEVARAGIVDEEDRYKDFFCSLQQRFLAFLNFSATGSEDAKVGYQLTINFFMQGVSHLNNEFVGYPHLGWLSGELTAWIKKLSLTKQQGKSQRKTMRA